MGVVLDLVEGNEVRGYVGSHVRRVRVPSRRENFFQYYHFVPNIVYRLVDNLRNETLRVATPGSRYRVTPTASQDDT